MSRTQKNGEISSPTALYYHIFKDSTAEALLGDDYGLIARSMTQGLGFFLPAFNGSPEDGLRLIVDRQLSPSVLGRSVFYEDELRRSGCVLARKT